jgi:hypothetical protein
MRVVLVALPLMACLYASAQGAIADVVLLFSCHVQSVCCYYPEVVRAAAKAK